MCRFFGGFAYSHPALASYDYFWRLDSNVRYLCAPPYDPAQYVADNDLDYGKRLCACSYQGRTEGARTAQGSFTPSRTLS